MGLLELTLRRSDLNFKLIPSSILICCTHIFYSEAYIRYNYLYLHSQLRVTLADYSGRSRDSRTPITMPWRSGSNTYLSVLTRHRPHMSALFPVSDAPGRICFQLNDSSSAIYIWSEKFFFALSPCIIRTRNLK